MKPKALILTGHGINCDRETEFAFNQAGADASRLHLNDLIESPERLNDFQIIAFPGGFSFGDDIAAGRVLAAKFRSHLGDRIKDFLGRDKLAIGICNGFQVMIKLGLFADFDGATAKQEATLFWNDSGRFEDRWVNLGRTSDKCVFTMGLESFEAPVAHGEGKFIANPNQLEQLVAADRIALRYLDGEGNPAGMKFPANPNGSMADIAGICDDSGRIFGMMPHPERHLFFSNHPLWTRKRETLKREGKSIPDEGAGRIIFDNALAYFK